VRRRTAQASLRPIGNEDQQQLTAAKSAKSGAWINIGRLAADKEMTMTIRKIIFSVAAVAAASIAAVPASAQETESARVYYGDLNLASEAGKATFDNRVRRAADRICGTPDARDLKMSALIAACKAEVIASAAPQRDALLASNNRYAQVSLGGSSGR
jgi:UrcA family protein